MNRKFPTGRTRSGLATALLAVVACVLPCAAQQKRIYLAPDDHTDFIWTATEAEYNAYFPLMLDYYLDQVDATEADPFAHRSRFTTDGTWWLWQYEQQRTPAQFDRLMGRIQEGYINAPLVPLCVMQGCLPAEMVIRQMLYAGSLERRFNVRFSLVHAMENQVMPLGVGALWAGAGARYIWHGMCGCDTVVPGLGSRESEVYWWKGLDGSRLLIKWFSLNDNQSLGGYAEARNPGQVVDIITSDAGFSNRYPFSISGAFGQGWDDRITTNLSIRAAAIGLSNTNRLVLVSNETDYFEDFEAAFGDILEEKTLTFGNEWDTYCASMAEVSAVVKRAAEKLRAAEAMAVLAGIKNPALLDGRSDERNLAHVSFGLYFEHDFIDGGPGASGAERIAFERRAMGAITNYVETLHRDAGAALGSMIESAGSTGARFFAFNPLGWNRSDFADFEYGTNAPPSPFHVVDLATGLEAPAQLVTNFGRPAVRVEASGVPPAGYKVFEIRQGTGSASFPALVAAHAASGVVSNGVYLIRMASRGAVTNLIDKARAREFAGNSGGRRINDLGTGSGTLSVLNAGPVSATLRAVSTSGPAHATRLTLFRDSDRIAIENEITENFDAIRTWGFAFDLPGPDVRHEEVGAVIRARGQNDGGHYAATTARYDWLTLNHFADMTSPAQGVGATLANWDCYAFKLGNSTASSLDTATPLLSPLAGGRMTSGGIANQAGDTHFLQRFALRTHGAFDQSAAMRFAMEFTNPLVTGLIPGGGTQYPAASYSLLTVSDTNVLLWALKPAEDGINRGVIVRSWNQTTNVAPVVIDFAPNAACALRVTHVETPLGAAQIDTDRNLSFSAGPVQIQTHAVLFSGAPLPFRTWQTNHFSAAELLDPAISGAGADPDHDGLDNATECALRSGPKSFSPDARPAGEVRQYTDGPFLSLRFPHDARAFDLRSRVQASDDLVSWTNIAEIVGGAGDGPGFVGTHGLGTLLEAEVRDIVPTNASKRRFLRLSIDRTE